MIFFVPFNGSDFGFRSELATHFGCGVSFFLQASEQASRARNSSVPKRGHVSAPNIYCRSTGGSVSAGPPATTRAFEVRSGIAGAGPDEARPQPELVRVRRFLACGAEEIHLCPNADHSIALAHPREWAVRAYPPRGPVSCRFGVEAATRQKTLERSPVRRGERPGVQSTA